MTASSGGVGQHVSPTHSGHKGSPPKDVAARERNGEVANFVKYPVEVSHLRKMSTEPK